MKPEAKRALVRRVGGQLHDERCPWKPCRECGAHDQPRRVDDVRAPGAAADLRRRREMAQSGRDAARCPSHRIGLGLGRSRGSRHHLDVVSAPSRKPATSGAWLAGPPMSGGQIPETIRSLKRRSLRSIAGLGPATAGFRSRSHDRGPREPRTRSWRRGRPRPRARGAPEDPRTRISGTSTTVSIRGPGSAGPAGRSKRGTTSSSRRSWSAPASRRRRAARVASV